MEPIAAQRLQRLISHMLTNGMTQGETMEPSPTALSMATGRKVNYCNDLLKGNKSFGSKVARDLERELGLAPYFLDGIEHPSDDYQPDFVRRIHQRLSAGSGHAAFYDAKESWLAFQPKFLQSVGVSPKNAAIFDVSGRSMEPELHDGAVVLINMNAKYESIINGKHYAFIHDDECKVKTLYKLKDGSIRAVSQNPDKETFPDFIIPNNEHEKLEILGLVLWEGRVV